ncbi:MAG: type I DNA topoisomerase [Myxococcota bacterium]
MSRSLVIVESPAKAKTIQKYLGEGFVVESSIGHIRDLAVPKNLDKKLRKSNAYINSYAVDVDNNFAPIYLVSDGRKSHIAELRRQLKASDELLLATDEDREGESIAWHLLEVLKPKVPVRRMVFHEITPKAIKNAVESPREIDQHLVDAQEARRILDRLYGFAMTMVVRQRARSRSAGRVQSVATRAVVERERERIAFVRASYWDLNGTFQLANEPAFDASLARIDGKRVASGRDYNESGELKGRDVFPLDEAGARALSEKLKGKSFRVGKVERKPYKRSPAAPFMTSTLQQEAGRKFRFSSSRTMRAAQMLYENGFITYMRTDSTTLSTAAIGAARRQITELYDEADLPKAPRQYTRKVKNAQEAHEAIRPAGDRFKTPVEVAKAVSLPDAKKVYELIWKRTIASQMEDARGHTITLRLHANVDGQDTEFSVSGTTITFPGFLKAYEEGTDDEGEKNRTSRRLPNLQEGQEVVAKAIEPKGHETQPPSRYTEASLVKWLEERGIGRPSTYASIINVIQERGYVWKKGSAMIPTCRAFQVIRMLEDHFGHLIDYDFTARMEDDLDAIASGDAERSKWLKRFFFGGDNHEGLEALVERKMAQLNPGTDDGLAEIRRLESFDIGETKEGKTIQLRMGNYGPYLTYKGETGTTASVPEDLPPDELTLARATEIIEAPKDDRPLGTDPETGLTIFLKAGRFGSYVQVGEVEKGSKEKPKTASLLSTMEPAKVGLKEALQVLSLPRVVGKAPDGEEIQATNGRYGAYIVKGKENRSLETEDQIFTVTVEECMKLLAEPKRGRRRAKPPLRELGIDPVSEKPIVLKDGNWGPYVTDGETNASLRTGDHIDSITPERAQELLQLRRDKGPTKKRKSSKKSTKKSTKKKSTKKSTKKAAKKSTRKSTKKAAKKRTTKKAAKKATKAKDSAAPSSP